MQDGLIVVTGANGFVGRNLVRTLDAEGYRVRRIVRNHSSERCTADVVAVGDISGDTYWNDAVTGAQTIVHLAGLAHVDQPDENTTKELYYRINAEGTQSLAKAAIKAGVRRFILVSSIGVNGPSSVALPFTASDEPRPANAFARSKAVAEVLLREAAEHTGMEWTVLRPPMIYGPDAPGNFARLAKLAKTGLPMPVGASTARRGFVAIDNIVDLMKTLITHPAAANRLFLVRDNEQPTIGELIEMICSAIGQRSRVVAVSPRLVKLTLSTLGRSQDYERLFAPLEIDISSTTEVLNWTPPVPMQHALSMALSSELRA